jgi:hypothetical protein
VIVFIMKIAAFIDRHTAQVFGLMLMVVLVGILLLNAISR